LPRNRKGVVFEFVFLQRVCKCIKHRVYEQL